MKASVARTQVIGTAFVTVLPAAALALPPVVIGTSAAAAAAFSFSVAHVACPSATLRLPLGYL